MVIFIYILLSMVVAKVLMRLHAGVVAAAVVLVVTEAPKSMFGHGNIHKAAPSLLLAFMNTAL